MMPTGQASVAVPRYFGRLLAVAEGGNAAVPENTVLAWAAVVGKLSSRFVTTLDSRYGHKSPL